VLINLPGRSLPMALGSCVMLGGAVGLYDYAGEVTGSTETREEKRRKFFKTPPKPLIDRQSSDE